MNYFYNATLLRDAYLDRDNEYIIITPPTEPALVLATLKSWLRMDPNDTTEDSILNLLISQAVGAFEAISHRTLMNTGFETFRSCWLQCYELRRSKLVSIDEVSYNDAEELPVIVDPSNYSICKDPAYSKLLFTSLFTFPEKSDLCDSIQIKFTAGLAATTGDVPADIQMALMQYIMFLYENRGDCACSDFTAIPTSSKRVFKYYQIVEIGA